VELCQRLGRIVADGTVECVAETQSDRLALFQAVELGTMLRRSPDPAVPGTDKLIDIGWVAYVSRIPRGPTSATCCS